MYNTDFQKFRAEINAWARNREREFLEDWCAEAGLKEPIAYDFMYHKGFTIYTNHPGILIGKAGNLISKYRNRLKEEFGTDGIKLIEIKSGFANY